MKTYDISQAPKDDECPVASWTKAQTTVEVTGGKKTVKAMVWGWKDEEGEVYLNGNTTLYLDKIKAFLMFGMKNACYAKIGTVPGLVCLDQRCTIKEGKPIRFKEARHGSKWQSAIIKKEQPLMLELI